MSTPVQRGASAQVKGRSGAPDREPANIAPTITLDDARRRATLTVDECAVLLMVSRSSAYEACARGQIPVVRIGRRLRVSAVALLRMLDADGSDG